MPHIKHAPILQAAGGAAEMWRSPIDRYHIGRSWLGFYRKSMSGVVFWGDVRGEDLLELAKLIPIRTELYPEPQPMYVDLRDVRGFDASLLDVREQLLADNQQSAIAFMTRCATVVAPGPIAAIAVGMRVMLEPPFPEQFFDDPVDAMRWLGCEQEIPLIAELEYLRTQALRWPMVTDLRAVLERRGPIALRDAAREVGVSSRSLQRSLGEIGTSYQRERRAAIVAKAQRLLLASRANVTEVAGKVGCSSPQQLSALFRDLVGESPSEWRARHGR